MIRARIAGQNHLCPSAPLPLCPSAPLPLCPSVPRPFAPLLYFFPTDTVSFAAFALSHSGFDPSF